MPLPDDLTNVTRTPPIINEPKQPQPVSSVSVSKERGSLSEETILEEVRAGIETEISKEVKEAGVTEIKETIELPQKVAKQTGVVAVGEGVPVSTQPTLRLPLDDQKIKQGLKKNVVDSVLWLAHWCLRQIKIAKLKALKLIGISKETA